MQASTYITAQAALADENLTVPPVPAATTGMAWLRATVARFSSGPTHTRRRAIAEAQISTIDISTLRKSAQTRTTELLAASPNAPVDLMSVVARTLPTELLAAALGIPAKTPSAVAAIARAYPTGAPDPAADAAVDDLVADTRDEATAARIGLLAQSYDATAGLIGNAAFMMLHNNLHTPAEATTTKVTTTAPMTTEPITTEAVIAETLRHTPPVRATKRITPTGDLINIDIAAANHDPSVFPAPNDFDPTRANREAHLDFGFGPHNCPGRNLATAIAAGVLDAISNHHLLTQTPTYTPSPTLTILTHLTITPTKPEFSPHI